MLVGDMNYNTTRIDIEWTSKHYVQQQKNKNEEEQKQIEETYIVEKESADATTYCGQEVGN